MLMMDPMWPCLRVRWWSAVQGWVPRFVPAMLESEKPLKLRHCMTILACLFPSLFTEEGSLLMMDPMWPCLRVRWWSAVQRWVPPFLPALLES